MKTTQSCPPVAEARLRLRAWFRTPPGQHLHEALRGVMDRVLPGLFGYHLVQIGSLGNDKALTVVSRIRHQVLADPAPDCLEAGLRADAAALPLASDSVDVVLLMHVLEFEPDPHQVLREVERVLVPEGHVVIAAFNPWGLMGLWKLFRRLWPRGRDEAPWCGRFFGRLRVQDWLSLLGFDIVQAHGVLFRPPFRHAGAMNGPAWPGRRGWPFPGGAYILVARKRISTLPPIRPRWRPRRSLVAGVAEPSARVQRRNR